MLAPFLEPARLEAIFGDNLLEDPSQLEGFWDLCAAGRKPYECVGEQRESLLAFLLLLESRAWRDSAVVKALRPEIEAARHLVAADLEGGVPVIESASATRDRVIRLLSQVVGTRPPAELKSRVARPPISAPTRASGAYREADRVVRLTPRSSDSLTDGAQMILESIKSPADLKALSLAECDQLAGEIRDFIVEAVSKNGGHLGSNLGVVELTLALHRVFNSPEDIFLFDTGHQAYVHKLITGRSDGFAQLKQEGGLSGYPSREESPHDLIENSHASTALSYAHGIATSLRLTGRSDPERGGRFVVAVVGDGALTGGMAYEALNNLGHSGARVLIVLNDNGRSYAPTVSRLSVSLTQLRLDPRYLQVRERVRHLVEDLPGASPRWPSPPSTGSARRFARSSSRGCSSRRSASATPGRSTDTTSEASSSRSGGLRPGTVRSCSTSSPPRARATPRPRRTTSRACTT